MGPATIATMPPVTTPAAGIGAASGTPSLTEKSSSEQSAFVVDLESALDAALQTSSISVGDAKVADKANAEMKTTNDRGKENDASQTNSKEPDRRPMWQLMGQWKFSGAQIADIVTAVSRHTNIYEPELFDIIAKSFLLRLQEFSTDQLKKVRDAFDLVRHDKNFDFHRNLTMSLKQRQTRRPCQAWRRGTCQFGERCVYSHED